MFVMFFLETYFEIELNIELAIHSFFNFFAYTFIVNPAKFILVNVIGFNIDFFVYGFLDGFVKTFAHETGLTSRLNIGPDSPYAAFMEKLNELLHAVALDFYEAAAPVPTANLNARQSAINNSPVASIIQFVADYFQLKTRYAALTDETKAILWFVPVTVSLIAHVVIAAYILFFFYSLLALLVCVAYYGDSYLTPTSSDVLDLVAADEEEIGSLDDILFMVLTVIASGLWFFLLVVLYYAHPVTAVGAIFVVYPWVLLALFAAPINSFIDYGLAFPAYLRGSVNTSFLSFEAMFDCIAVCTALTRLTAQQIRILFVFVAYAEVEHFVYTNSLATESPYVVINSYFNNIADQTDIWNSAFYLLVDFPLFFFNTIYLLFHFMEMLINQLVVYFILVFWFFAFLYNYFFYKKLEKHFSIKRRDE